MDLVIAVVIFGFMSVMFYSLILLQQKPSVDDLRQDAERVNERLGAPIGSCGVIIEGQTVTPERLQCLFGMDYEQLRRELNMKGDFCIYIEDTSGRLYIVNSPSGNYTGFGHPNLVISGTPCGVPRT
jgi:hypothetical protein